MQNHKRLYSIIIIVGVLVTSIIIWIWSDDFWKSKPNLITFIGTSASLIGLIITYLESRRARIIAELTKQVAEETKKELLSKIDLPDISITNESVDSIIDEFNNLPITKATVMLNKFVKIFTSCVEDENFMKTGESYLIHLTNAKEILKDARFYKKDVKLKIPEARRKEIIHQLTEMSAVLTKILNNKTRK